MGRVSGRINMITRVYPLAWGIKDHLIIMKPGIVFLVLVTTFAGMYIGAKGLPPVSLTLLTFLGVGMAAGGAATLNNLFDRFIDGMMERTKKRPLPTGRIYPSKALLLGLSLCVTSIVIFAVFLNTLTAFLTLLSTFVYVFPYTLLLKRKTPLATLVGSITGALPPVIGYTSVKNYITLEALLPFFIMYVWQHPHFWSLALKYRDDYRRAGIPVLPVSAGIKRTKVMVFISVIVLCLISLMPYYSGLSGKGYLSGVLVLGAIYMVLSLLFILSKKDYDEYLFFYSLVYLSLLFIFMTLDMEAS